MRGQSLTAAALVTALLIGVGTAAVLVAFGSVTFSLSVVVGGVVAAAAIMDSFYGLVLFLLVLLLRPTDHWPQLAPLRPALVTIVTAFFIWMAQYLITRRPRLQYGPATVCVAGLYLWEVLSTVANAGFSPASLVAQALLSNLLIFWLVHNLIRTPSRLRSLVWLFVACMAFNAVYAVQAQGELAEVEGRVELVGMMSDPNDLALVLVVALALALGLRAGERSSALKWTATAIAGLNIWVILATLSRGGAMGMAVVLYLEGFRYLRHPKARRAYALGALLLVVIGVNVRFVLRGGSIGSTWSEDESFLNRRAAWSAGRGMMFHYPLFGVSPGQFADRFDEYAPDYATVTFLSAHNTFVQAGAELGVPGLLLFVALLYVTFLNINRARRLLMWLLEAAAARDVGPFGSRAARAPPASMLEPLPSTPAPPALMPPQPLTRVQVVLTSSLLTALISWCVCAFFLHHLYKEWLYILCGLAAACFDMARNQAWSWSGYLAAQREVLHAGDTQPAPAEASQSDGDRLRD